LDASYMFGAIPSRYKVAGLDSGLETYFAMGRGVQKPGVDIPSLSMIKYLDSNYHIFPALLEDDQKFNLNSTWVVDHYLEAKAIGIETRPVIFGPVSFLHFARASGNPFKHLSKLIPVYVELLKKLADAGAKWVQIDEPCLVFDLPQASKDAFQTAYTELAKVNIDIFLATFGGSLRDNAQIVEKLPIKALHIDLVRAPEQLNDKFLSSLPQSMSVSLGLVDGRNIWKCDLDNALQLAEKAVTILGKERVSVGPSSSLMFSPHSLDAETKMDPEIKDWLSFATEKVTEVAIIAKALNNGRDSVANELAANKKSLDSRRSSRRIHNPTVKDRMKAVSPDMFRRKAPFAERQQIQRSALKLPKFPTTTIGSFPQTKEVRLARARVKKGEFTQQQYDDFINKETERCIRFQEDIDIDVLVHGEFERNDMVEFFGENLEGYVFSQNGWVASYGTRCVKPPIIYGDVSRKRPITVEMSSYAQSLTKRLMKGMLTGPITCLQWSFVRNDQPRSETAFQLALAIRDEVVDLEQAGIRVIQVDEPAIREGLPLRKSEQPEYLKWAVDAFLLTTTGVNNETQVHTHMCYSEFNEIFDAIQRMDADVATIESSKSDLKILSATANYKNELGPGLYDIHSPRVPSVEEMLSRVRQMLKYIPSQNFWVNPDCGLKTRGWAETEAALKNMVQVAYELRKSSAVEVDVAER